jgi:hypothetical protein
MFVVAGELAVEQLDTTDFNHAVAVVSGQPGGFSIQKYLAHGWAY